MNIVKEIEDMDQSKNKVVIKTKSSSDQKLELKQKKINTFKKRSKTSIYILAVYLSFLLCIIFSNHNWFGYIENKFNSLFAVFALLILTPFFYFASKEITNLYFLNKKKTIAGLMTFFMFVYIYIMCLIFVFPKYFDDIPIKINIYMLTRVFIILFFCINALVIIASILIASLSKNIKQAKRHILWFPILNFLVPNFFLIIMYLGIINTWTTIFLLLVICILSDVFAYLCGTLFGKHHTFKKVSPNKTSEGCLISIALTTVVTCALLAIFHVYQNNFHSVSLFCGYQFKPFYDIFFEKNNWWWTILILFVIVLIVVSMAGDLLYSKIKRDFQVKDFSNLLAGHGGILDRIDSLSLIFIFFFLFSLLFVPCFNQFSNYEMLWRPY